MPRPQEQFFGSDSLCVRFVQFKLVFIRHWCCHDELEIQIENMES